MIDPSEIHEAASDTGLNPYVIEKDYVIGWVLAGIYNHPDIREAWVFKGGTCLTMLPRHGCRCLIINFRNYCRSNLSGTSYQTSSVG